MNSDSPPPVVVIMGPTASGKSALALRFARERNGEIVSADSMQLYRGLEIGTAQPTPAERAEIPHHLVGCFDFHERIDVFTYCRLADEAIAEIRARGHLPIVAGGTGFYIKSLLYGLDDLPADPVLRRELDARYDSDAAEDELRTRLAELDPAAALKFARCRRRMLRALEVVILTGKSILELQRRREPHLRFPVEAWRLDPAPDELKRRIARRTDAMLADGWIDEARTALARGLLDTPTAWQALGYRQIGDFLAGKCDYETMRQRIVTATWQFARRQRTWFAHQHPEGRLCQKQRPTPTALTI